MPQEAEQLAAACPTSCGAATCLLCATRQSVSGRPPVNLRALQLKHPCGVMPDRVVTLMRRHIAAQAKAYPQCFTSSPPAFARGTWQLPTEISVLSYTSPEVKVRPQRP